MDRLIGNTADSCTGTCVVSEGIISWRAKIRNARHITAERGIRKTMIKRLRCQPIPRIACTIIKSIVIGTAISRGAEPKAIRPRRRMPYHSSINTGSKDKNKINDEKNIQRKTCQSSKDYTHSNKGENFQNEDICLIRTFFLHSNFFNIFNHNFRHHISRFIHLTYLKYRRIQKEIQEKRSFYIYKCIYML